MPQDGKLTIKQAIQQALETLDAPINLSDFVKRVVQIRPSSAKHYEQTIRSTLRWELVGNEVIFLDDHTLVPSRRILPGIRFRAGLSEYEIKRGILLPYVAFNGWLGGYHSLEGLALLDERNRPLPLQRVRVTRGIRGILGDFQTRDDAFQLADWFETHRATPEHTLIVTIDSWFPRRFRLELEPPDVRAQHADAIQRKNQELTEMLFKVLDSFVDEFIPANIAIPTAYAHLSEPKGYPGDPWFQVVQRDPRLRWDGIGITYSDHFNLLEMIEISMGGGTLIEPVPFSPDEGRRVWGFKAQASERRGLWRRVEIQGKQTLAQLDRCLRRAFELPTLHTSSDLHKLIRRGNRRRRRVYIGRIRPHDGESQVNQLPIAALGLTPGDQLEYIAFQRDYAEVYTLTLESIGASRAGVRYPREIERSKPRRRYCAPCREQGKRTVAYYHCLDCSAPRRQIYLCEHCVQDHDDHFLVEIDYR